MHLQTHSKRNSAYLTASQRPVKSVCLYSSFSRCAILNNDKVKCWGLNSLGQLGLGHNRNIGFKAEEMGEYLPDVNLGTVRLCMSNMLCFGEFVLSGNILES